MHSIYDRIVIQRSQVAQAGNFRLLQSGSWGPLHIHSAIPRRCVMSHLLSACLRSLFCLHGYDVHVMR